MKSGITRIKSIVPIAAKPTNETNAEIALQIDVECRIEALTRFLYKIGASEMPLQVQKVQINGETGDPDIVGTQIQIDSLWMEEKTGN